MNYYNEIDPFAAKWLRSLIASGCIPKGDVDERSIADVRPSDVAGYTQCHFFAGIGGWSHALKLAKWPSSKPVWTGSCPCQPFSSAGKRKGFADERHLWPAFYGLIRECHPPVVFGEQVASKDGLHWFDTVQTDLENAYYAVGAADLCAASVGAPHIRQRLYFVADSVRGGTRYPSRQSVGTKAEIDGKDGGVSREGSRSRFNSTTGGVADNNNSGLPERISNGRVQRETVGASEREASVSRGDFGRLVNSESEQAGLPRCTWFDGRPSDWIECLDGKKRPVEPGTFPLAHGIPKRVGRLRGYGNAIVPQVAQAFIESFMEK